MKWIDTTNMCSHLQRKLFAPDGEYRAIREQIESDPTLTAIVRSRQLHIYRDGKKILVLAGKSAPKIIREDRLTELLSCYFSATGNTSIASITRNNNTGHF